MIKRWSPIAIPFLLGFGIGVCISLILVGMLYANRLNQLSAAITPTLPPPTTTIIPTQVIETATPPIVEMIEPSAPSEEELLAQAEADIFADDPEKVKDLLLPVIENWESLSYKARGYKLLGDAEVAQGHPQLAIPYYEEVYFYKPTPDNLFTIAFTEDMGGDLCSALKHYQELDSWGAANVAFDRDFVKSRIKDISCSLGTKTP